MTGPYREAQEVPKEEKPELVFCGTCKFFVRHSQADEYPSVYFHHCSHPALQETHRDATKEWFAPPMCEDVNRCNNCEHFDEYIEPPKKLPWYKRIFK